MGTPLEQHPDRLFPADPVCRSVARRLYEEVKALPIISPHGHTDPAWFAENNNFADPQALLIGPDHYLLRMLYSQGIRLADLGIATRTAQTGEAVADPRSAWRLFARNHYLFAAPPPGSGSTTYSAMFLNSRSIWMKRPQTTISTVSPSNCRGRNSVLARSLTDLTSSFCQPLSHPSIV